MPETRVSWNKGLTKKTDLRLANFGMYEHKPTGRRSETYAAKHVYFREFIAGSANHCELDLAHISIRYHWANLDHKYSMNPSDYIQLCPKCHKSYDYGKLKINGKTFIDRGGIPDIVRVGGFRGHHHTKKVCQHISECVKLQWLDKDGREKLLKRRTAKGYKMPSSL